MAAHPRFALDATPLATGAAVRATVTTDERAALALGPTRVAEAGAWRDARRFGSSPPRRLLQIPPGTPNAIAHSSPRAREQKPRSQRRVRSFRQADAFHGRAPRRTGCSRRTGAGGSSVLASVPVSSRRFESPRPPRRCREPASRTVRNTRGDCPMARRVRAEGEPDLVALETDWSRKTRAVTEADSDTTRSRPNCSRRRSQ